jgi:hypothetical protein
VVFTPAGKDGTSRPGVIVFRDLEGARREARNIALSGGRAQVRYVGEDGARIIARYPDGDRSRLSGPIS